GGQAQIVVAANGAVPAVGSDFDRSCQPELLEPAAAPGGDVLRAPENVVIMQVGSELPDLEKQDLVAEDNRVDVVPRGRLRSCRTAGDAAVVARGVRPAVRAGQIAAPCRVREVVLVVVGVQM